MKNLMVTLATLVLATNQALVSVLATGDLFSPPTGDNSPTLIILVVLGLAAATFVVALLLTLKKKK